MTTDDHLLLRAFAEHNMNVTDTANAVYMHRNSLVYRLQVIHRETGLNPRKFYDLVKLLGLEVRHG